MKLSTLKERINLFYKLATEMDWYKAGFKFGEEDAKNYPGASDIVSMVCALGRTKGQYNLDPNRDDYEEKVLDVARGYIDGSKMPLKGMTYGRVEGEMAAVRNYLNKIKKMKEEGKQLEPGEYFHP